MRTKSNYLVKNVSAATTAYPGLDPNNPIAEAETLTLTFSSEKTRSQTLPIFIWEYIKYMFNRTNCFRLRLTEWPNEWLAADWQTADWLLTDFRLTSDWLTSDWLTSDWLTADWKSKIESLKQKNGRRFVFLELLSEPKKLMVSASRKVKIKWNRDHQTAWLFLSSK